MNSKGEKYNVRSAYTLSNQMLVNHVFGGNGLLEKSFFLSLFLFLSFLLQGAAGWQSSLSCCSWTLYFTPSLFSNIETDNAWGLLTSEFLEELGIDIVNMSVLCYRLCTTCLHVFKIYLQLESCAFGEENKAIMVIDIFTPSLLHEHYLH